MSFVRDLIAKYEGCRLTAYKDSLGLWTIGYGRLLDQSKDWTDYTIGQTLADQWLDEDIQKAWNLARQFPHWTELNEVRQAVLCSMTFQLGSKPLYWPNFIRALEDEDYYQAEAEGLDSRWAEQTPQRARDEMAMLAEGKEL